MSLARLLPVAVLALTLVAGCAPAPPPPSPVDPGGPVTGPPRVAGLAVYRAAGDVPATVTRLRQALARSGAEVETVDHAANAAAIGETLRPTTLVIGDDPRTTTAILGAAPAAGLNLPAKFLVWQDEAGEVWLGHNTAAYVAARANAQPNSPAIQTLANELRSAARAGARSEEPAAPGDDPSFTENYLRTTPSARSVPQSVAALERSFRTEGLQALGDVDHAAQAAAIGVPLAANTVLLAGDPALATPLIQDRQTIAIDLPTRFQVRSDGATTSISYPDPALLGFRHGLRRQDDAIARLAQSQEALARM